MKLTDVRCVCCYGNFCVFYYIATLDELPKAFVSLHIWKCVGFKFHTPSTSTSITLCFFVFSCSPFGSTVNIMGSSSHMMFYLFVLLSTVTGGSFRFSPGYMPRKDFLTALLLF